MAWWVYSCQHRRFVGPHGTNGQSKVNKLCPNCSDQFEKQKNSLACLMDEPAIPNHEEGMRQIRGHGEIGRRKGLKIPQE